MGGFLRAGSGLVVSKLTLEGGMVGKILSYEYMALEEGKWVRCSVC